MTKFRPFKLGGCSGRMVKYLDGTGDAADVDTLENATLFAAAPDLLAACKLFVEGGFHGLCPCAESGRSVADAVKAAIAKAVRP